MVEAVGFSTHPSCQGPDALPPAPSAHLCAQLEGYLARSPSSRTVEMLGMPAPPYLAPAAEQALTGWCLQSHMVWTPEQ